MKKSFLNDYFVAIYDLQDNYVYSFDDIESLTQFFNLSLKEILLKIKNNLTIKLQNKEFRLYIYKKPKYEWRRRK